ncbi:MAG TPA: hypothetical protein VK324_06785, partial [Tepidisphaeraceae bacterium]|nr:hypothetical protein [Tepidisphaeraceae bacterium]
EEGFCLSFLEAASIVPRLVGTATGDIPGMVIGPGMRLVVPRSAEALTAGIRAALADTVPPTAVAARRATLDERYSWDQYVRQHLDLYAQLAAAPRT